MINRGSRRRHQDRQEHEIFPLHDDNANLGPELNYDDFSEHSESEDCSGDDDSPIATQVVDYTNLEALKQHRLQVRGSSQQSSRIPTPAAGSGGSARLDLPPSRGGHLLFRGSSQSNTLQGNRRTARLYRNPDDAAQLGFRGRMPRQCSRSSEQSHHNSHAFDDVVMERRSGHIPKYTTARAQRKTVVWTEKDLNAALAAFDDGMSMKKAAKTNNIPYSTFREWCFGVRTSRKKGPPSVLSPSEEEELVKYLIEMCDRGFGLTPSAFRMKVYEITKSRWTPFRNGIPGNGWMRWWKKRHPKLTLRVSQALESARAKGLCEENVRSFYENLQHLYTLHNYPADRIWNCDESGAQAGRNGGVVVIARRGAQRVHSIVPNQREWSSVLVCINTAGLSIPSFYIFRGKRFCQNYIEKCEAGATMAMQQRAWMTSYLKGVFVKLRRFVISN